MMKLKGGIGSRIVINKPKRVTVAKSIENNRSMLEAAIDHEAAIEAASMSRHRQIRPDKQKIGWLAV